MDIVKREMMNEIGPGGLKCTCCNYTRQKKGNRKGKKRIITQIARAAIKAQDRKEQE